MNMCKMKKVLAGVLAGAMMLACTVTAFAGSITSAEQGLLDKMSSAASSLGVNGTNTYNKYYGQVESYLMKNDATANQIKAGKESVDIVVADIKAEMTAQGVTKATDLKGKLSTAKIQSLISATISKVAPKLEAVGITIKADGTAVTVTDKKNNSTIVSTKPTVKQTGFDMQSTMVVLAALAGALTVCGVVAKKKNLLEAR